jgi:hypothetical protein
LLYRTVKAVLTPCLAAILSTRSRIAFGRVEGCQWADRCCALGGVAATLGEVRGARSAPSRQTPLAMRNVSFVAVSYSLLHPHRPHQEDFALYLISSALTTTWGIGSHKYTHFLFSLHFIALQTHPQNRVANRLGRYTHFCSAKRLNCHHNSLRQDLAREV